IAALIWGGETWKLAAICGSEVEMMEESSPSMKKAPAMTIGTISDICAAGGSVRPESNSVTNEDEGLCGADAPCVKLRSQEKPTTSRLPFHIGSNLAI